MSRNTPDFDKDPEFESEIKPLLSQLHDACVKHDIAFVAGFAIGAKEDKEKEGTDWHCAASVYFNGEKTPDSFVAVRELLGGEKPRVGKGMVEALLLGAILGGIGSQDEDDRISESETKH